MRRNIRFVSVFGCRAERRIRILIARFDLKTPGREGEVVPAAPQVRSGRRGEDFVKALGGAGNLVSVDACTTRLRLILVDQKAVNEQALKELGSRGMVRPSDKALQVVLGPIADQVAGEMRDALVGQSAPQRLASKSLSHPIDLDRWAAALGGRDNILQAELRAGRICTELNDASAVDEPALLKLGARGLAWPSAGSLQILLKPTL